MAEGDYRMKITVPKILWASRAVFSKFFFYKLKLPSYIGKPLYLEGYRRISIGKNVRIFPGIRMEAHSQGKITIEDNVYIGQNCHITSEDYDLTIGKGSAIMANVCITNIDHNYDSINIPVLEQGYTTRVTRIGENCFVGHNAVIQAGVQLGNHTIVGAGAVVNRGKYPSNCVIAGVPAKVVKVFDLEHARWERSIE